MNSPDLLGQRIAAQLCSVLRSSGDADRANHKARALNNRNLPSCSFSTGESYDLEIAPRAGGRGECGSRSNKSILILLSSIFSSFANNNFNQRKFRRLPPEVWGKFLVGDSLVYAMSLAEASAPQPSSLQCARGPCTTASINTQPASAYCSNGR